MQLYWHCTLHILDATEATGMHQAKVRDAGMQVCLMWLKHITATRDEFSDQDQPGKSGTLWPGQWRTNVGAGGEQVPEAFLAQVDDCLLACIQPA
jgi:hypothetical protein